jgi:hypothetical protein
MVRTGFTVRPGTVFHHMRARFPRVTDTGYSRRRLGTRTAGPTCYDWAVGDCGLASACIEDCFEQASAVRVWVEWR